MFEIVSEKYLAAVIAHTAATTAGTPLLINGLLMIPLNDADADADNVFVYEADKVKVAKATSQAWAVGSKIYWDNTNKNFTTSAGAGANTLTGYIAEPAVSADDSGYIVLRPLVDAA